MRAGGNAQGILTSAHAHCPDLTYLLRATRLSPHLDTAFFILQSRRQAEEEAQIGSSTRASATSRVAFESNLSKARALVLRALHAQASFWALLQAPAYDLAALHSAADEMSSSSRDAGVALGRALASNAASLTALRLCAEFALYVSNDVPRVSSREGTKLSYRVGFVIHCPTLTAMQADQLLAEADRIDEVQRREYLRETRTAVRFLEASSFDVMAENTAVVSIDCSAGALGTMTSVNTFASKLFGHAHGLLQRRNISMLMPSPFAEMHDSFLRRFLSSGAGRVVGCTRVVFGLHRAGHVFPMLLAVRESAAADGSLLIVGVMRSLSTSDQYIMLDASLRVTGATLESFALLGIQPETLEAERPVLATWVDDWESQLPSLRSDAGTRLCVRHVIASGGEEQLGSAHSQWVQAQLQEISLSGDAGTVFVLHWKHTVSAVEDDSRAAVHGAGGGNDGHAQHRQLSGTSQGLDDKGAEDAIATESRNVGERSGASSPELLRFTQGDDEQEAGSRTEPLLPGQVRCSEAADSTGQADDTVRLKARRNEAATILEQGAIAHVVGASTPPARIVLSVAESADEKLGGIGTSADPAERGVGAANADALVVTKSRVREHGSQASSRVSHGDALQNRMRRVIDEGDATGEQLLPNLRLLCWASLLLAAAAIGMSAALTAILSSSLGSYAGIIGLIDKRQTALSAATAMGRNGLRLYICREGWVAETCTPTIVAATRAEALRAAALFTTTHGGLYASAVQAGIASTTYDDSTAVAFAPHAGEGSGVALNASSPPYVDSLLVAGITLVSHAQALAVTPLEAIDWNSADLAFTLAASGLEDGISGAASVSGALNATALVWRAKRASARSSERLAADASFGSMMAMLAVLTFGVILPILRRVAASRDEALTPFIALAAPIVARLRARAEVRIRGIEEQLADDDGDEGDAEDDAAVALAGQLRAGEGEDADEENVPLDEDIGDVDWKALIARLGSATDAGTSSRGRRRISENSVDADTTGSLDDSTVSGRARGSKRPRRTRRARPKARASWLPVLRLVARFALPFVFVAGALATIYATSTAALSSAAALGDAALASSLLAIELDALPTAARRAVVAPGAGADSIDAAVCLSLVASVLYHAQLLERGAPTDVLPGASGAILSGAGLTSAIAGEVAVGFFSDGCKFLDNYGIWTDALLTPFSPVVCRRAQGGVVARGLHGAIAGAASAADAICTARSLADVPAGSGGVGTTPSVGVAGGTVPYRAASVLRSSLVLGLLNITENYATPGAAGLAVVYSAAAAAAISAQLSFLASFTGAFLAMLVLYMIIIYLPGVRRASTDEKRRQDLLCIVPAALLCADPGLHDACLRLLQGETAHGAARSVQL